MIDNISYVIRGKDDTIRLAIITLLARGHLLIEDVPGVGKTTLASSLATSLECTFSAHPVLPAICSPQTC